MSRIDRLISLCDRGMELLEDGDLEGAARQLDNARRIDPRHVEVLRLDASVSTASGDVERALGLFDQIAALAPDDATPHVAAAHLLLYADDRPEDALARVDRALELVDEEGVLVDAILVRADALLALGRPADARECLAELATSAIDDPGAALAIAETHLAAEDPAGALRWLDRVTGDEELGIDALHLAGCAHELLGHEEERRACWRRVLAADTAAPAPDWHLQAWDFEKVATEAFRELPARARELLENVPILIGQLPEEALVDDGLDPRSLGMIDGPNLEERAIGGDRPVPTLIVLYQKNLELAFGDPEELADQIRITLLHETAHYFGMDEDELAAAGLD